MIFAALDLQIEWLIRENEGAIGENAAAFDIGDPIVFHDVESNLPAAAAIAFFSSSCTLPASSIKTRKKERRTWSEGKRNKTKLQFRDS